MDICTIIIHGSLFNRRTALGLVLNKTLNHISSMLWHADEKLLRVLCFEGAETLAGLPEQTGHDNARKGGEETNRRHFSLKKRVLHGVRFARRGEREREREREREETDTRGSV